MVAVHTVIVILALLCFLLAAIVPPRIDFDKLIAAGLFLLTLALLVHV